MFPHRDSYTCSFSDPDLAVRWHALRSVAQYCKGLQASMPLLTSGPAPSGPDFLPSHSITELSRPLRGRAGCRKYDTLFRKSLIADCAPMIHPPPCTDNLDPPSAPSPTACVERRQHAYRRSQLIASANVPHLHSASFETSFKSIAFIRDKSGFTHYWSLHVLPQHKIGRSWPGAV